MSSPHYDVIVLGMGAMGSAAAFELARRGRRVLGLDQFALGHDRGSSHGHTRIIRQAYFEHPSYVPLVQRAFERWYDLEQRSGEHLLTECGCLNLGLPEGELVPGIRRSAGEHGLAVEELAPKELRRRYPAFRFADEYVGVLERAGGFLYVERCVLAYADEARRLGADLRAQEPVQRWEATADGVAVHTAKQTYHADRLVVTAGAWAGRMLAELRLPLEVTRKVLFWFEPAVPELFRRDRFPIYLAETPEGFYYGFPMIDARGAKVARHDGGDIVADPLTVKRDATPGDEADVRRFVQAHLPGADGPRRDANVCLYTLTPDRHFIIDVHPWHPQVVLAAGFSGHGFKFASVVGECLADLAEGAQPTLSLEMFRLARFHSSVNRPISSANSG